METDSGAYVGASSSRTVCEFAWHTKGLVVFELLKGLEVMGIFGVMPVTAGLDYPGVGPEHAFLHAMRRAHYAAVRDEAAVNAFRQLSLSEGIIPALESAHALAYATRLAKGMKRNSVIVVTLSGRGDKDVQVVAEAMGDEV